MKKFDLQIPRKQYSWFKVGVLFLLLLLVGCRETTNLVVKHQFSNLVLDGDTLWFGAGYKLYRVDLNQKTATIAYDTGDVPIFFVQIDETRLFFGGGRPWKKVIWALDLNKEKENILWSHEFSEQLSSSSAHLSPPLINKEVLMTSTLDELYAFNKVTGYLMWKIDKNRFDSLVLTPILANDQLIYGVYKFDEKGTKANNTIAIADPTTGETNRIITMPGYLGGIPAVHGDCFFVKEDLDPDPTGVNMTDAHVLRLNCMDFHTGEVLGSVEGRGYIGNSQIGFHKGLVFDVFVDQLFAINEDLGTILWKSRELDKSYYNNPRITGDLNWIALETDFPGKVIFLELETGKVLDQELVNVLSSPIFIDHEAIYGTTNAIVHVDIVTGNLIWSIPVDSHYLTEHYDSD
jgi:outer membrane protein assembly factor BamB